MWKDPGIYKVGLTSLPIPWPARMVVPQLCSCGNPAWKWRWNPGCATTLQWGRNFAVAETGCVGSGRMARSGFNGAATLQLRKPSHATIATRAYRGFNGAATLQLRKQGGQVVGYGRFSLLQWGRNFAVAETWRSTARTPLTRLMLQWGRNFAVAETIQKLEHRSKYGDRFNGAATLQLRKLASGGACGRLSDWLQWGRNFAVAETPLRRVTLHAAIGLLQWGRNFAVAETNGMNDANDANDALQWGRNFAVAETRRYSSSDRVPDRLQWGRNFAVAETESYRTVGKRLYHASMGPQLCSCGNERHERRERRERCASMGPQLCSCGNTTLAAEWTSLTIASMGPQLCSCGNPRSFTCTIPI